MFLQTQSRKVFRLPPTEDMICIEDIAYALGRINRFAGQSDRFWSVAEHSILVSRLVPEHVALPALLHDASEAYINDVPSPVKRLAGNAIHDLETSIMKIVMKKYAGVHYGWHSGPVITADEVVLMSEREVIFPSDIDWEINAEPDPDTVKQIERWIQDGQGLPTEIRMGRNTIRFMNRFHELTNGSFLKEEITQ